MAAAGQFEGRVVAIRGAVIDLAFEGAPPPIEDAVEIVDCRRPRRWSPRSRPISIRIARARSRSSRRRA